MRVWCTARSELNSGRKRDVFTFSPLDPVDGILFRKRSLAT